MSKRKYIYIYILYTQTQTQGYSLSKEHCSAIHHVPDFTRNHYSKKVKGWYKFIRQQQWVTDICGRVMLGCFLLCWFNNQHWISSVPIYFNFCLIKCIKELMCWIWGFKMTFTQLFLNALGNFLNIIVLLNAKKNIGKKADCNHDIHTEGLLSPSDNGW